MKPVFAIIMALNSLSFFCSYKQDEKECSNCTYGCNPKCRHHFTDILASKVFVVTGDRRGVFAVAGGAGLGVLDGCAEKGVYSIGVDGDQYEILKDDDPETAAAICTSMEKKCDQTVYSCVSAALEGTLEYGSYDMQGLADGVVGISDNENYRAIFTEEQISALEDIEARVASGEVSVFTAIGADDASIQAIKDSVQ